MLRTTGLLLCFLGRNMSAMAWPMSQEAKKYNRGKMLVMVAGPTRSLHEWRQRHPRVSRSSGSPPSCSLSLAPALGSAETPAIGVSAFASAASSGIDRAVAVRRGPYSPWAPISPTANWRSCSCRVGVAPFSSFRFSWSGPTSHLPGHRSPRGCDDQPTCPPLLNILREARVCCAFVC